jgi:uncharacterized UPF0160 family protein
MMICTHDGVFQADEVFSVTALRAIYPEATIVRSRDATVHRRADIVVDVGGAYSHERKLYDHHQRGGAGQRPNGVQYSSAGLVWRHYGEQVVKILLDLYGNPQTSDVISRIHEMVDVTLVQPIDAADNGQRTHAPTPGFEGVRQFTISSMISAMNSPWFLPHDEELFDDAMVIMASSLVHSVKVALGRILAEDIVREAIQESGGSPIVQLGRFVPWQELVIEQAPEALFVVFEDVTGASPSYRVQAVPPRPGGKQNRKDLPFAWGGLSGDALVAASGVENATFCHRGLFIAGATTRDAAIALARIAASA